MSKDSRGVTPLGRMLHICEEPDRGNGRGDEEKRNHDTQQDTTGQTAPAHSAPATDLFVATDLSHFDEPKNMGLPRELTIVRGSVHTRYRKMDLRYYAWIRRNYDHACTMWAQHKISDSDMDELSNRFWNIHAWVLERMEFENLESALNRVNLEGFVPPKAGR